MLEKYIKSNSIRAPNNVALTFTSKSKGNEILKLSASAFKLALKQHWRKPGNLFWILPIFSPELILKISKLTSSQQMKGQKAVLEASILRIGVPLASLTINSGRQHGHGQLQSCWIVPIMVPGGLWTCLEIQKFKSNAYFYSCSLKPFNCFPSV